MSHSLRVPREITEKQDKNAEILIFKSQHNILKKCQLFHKSNSRAIQTSLAWPISAFSSPGTGFA